MIKGIVKWFDDQKGFGFIVRDDDGADVFIHISEIERCGLNSLDKGQKVLFKTGTGRNGFDAAFDIELV